MQLPVSVNDSKKYRQTVQCSLQQIISENFLTVFCHFVLLRFAAKKNKSQSTANRRHSLQVLFFIEKV